MSLEIVLKPLASQKMSDYEQQTKAIFAGIAALSLQKLPMYCCHKIAFYGR